MSRYITSQEVLSQFLPLPPGSFPLHPVDWSAIRGCQICYIVPSPITVSSLQQLTSVVNATSWVSSQAQLPALGLRVTLQITSDIGVHHMANNHTRQGHYEVEPFYWFITLVHDPTIQKGVPLSKGRQAAILQEHRATGLIATASHLREALASRTPDLAQSIKTAFDQLHTLSMTGQAYFHQVSAISPAIKLSRDGSCLVLHISLRSLGPWLLANTDDVDAIRNALQPDLDAIGSHGQLEFYNMLRVGPMPVRKDGEVTVDLGPSGLITDTLRWRLSQAKAQQAMARYNRTPIRRIPLDYLRQGYPDIGVLHILIRYNDQYNTKISEQVGRQVLTIVMNPPPGIELDFSNCSGIRIWVEAFSSSSVPAADRQCLQVMALHVKSHELVVAVSPDMFTRNVSEVGYIVTLFPNATCLGVLSEAASVQVRDNGDLEEFASDEAPEMDQFNSRWIKLKDHMARFTAHVSTQSHLFTESAFYRESHIMLERHAAIRVKEMKSRLEYLANVYHCISFTILARVSQGEIGEQNALNNSMNRQKVVATRSIPGNPSVIWLDQVSISSDGSAVVKEISTIYKCWIIAISLDRFARQPLAMRQIRRACIKNDNIMVCLYWPSEVVDYLSQHSNPLITADFKKKLDPSLAYASTFGSLPTYYPCMVAGRFTHPDVNDVVDERVTAGYMYVKALQASFFRGDFRMLLPNTLLSGTRIYGLDQEIRTALKDIIADRLRSNHLHIKWNPFRKDRIMCKCNINVCRPRCGCTCSRCQGKRTRACPHKREVAAKRGKPFLCNCNCEGCTH